MSDSPDATVADSPVTVTPDEDQAKGAAVRPYNFRRPRRIPRKRQVTLDAIHNRFALATQGLLSSRLRTPADVLVRSLEQARFGDFVSSLDNPCAAFTFATSNGKHRGVINISLDLAYYLIDRLFGGHGEVAKTTRPITHLERRVISEITEKVLELFDRSWEDLLTVSAEGLGFESTPEMLQIAKQEDTVLVATFVTRFGEFEGLISICLPFAVLETFLRESPSRPSNGPSRPEAERVATRAITESILRSASVPIAVRFPSFTLRAEEVATLRPGCVLHTNHPLDLGIEVQLSGRPYFSGQVGRIHQRIGVQITAFTPLPQRRSASSPQGRLM